MKLNIWDVSNSEWFCIFFSSWPPESLLAQGRSAVCALGKRSSLGVVVRGLWALQSWCGSGVSCRLCPEAGAPWGVLFLGFPFTSLVILCFTIKVPPFFGPFWPILSTRKLLRVLIGSSPWGSLLCSSGWTCCSTSQAIWGERLLFKNFQFVMNQYFCKRLEILNY